jgi:hypothetical protein
MAQRKTRARDGSGFACSSLIRLRPETFAAHHTGQAAQVMSWTLLARAGPSRADLESAWLANVRQGVRFWEQDGSGHGRVGALKRGDRGRMKPSMKPGDQPRRLPWDHPLARALCCGPGCRGFEWHRSPPLNVQVSRPCAGIH